MLQINQIKMDASENSDKNLRSRAIKILNLKESYIDEFKILRKSYDARKKPDIKIIYSVAISLKDKKKEEKLLKRTGKHKISEYISASYIINGDVYHPSKRPIIIGAGPAGLFAALLLSEKGFSPLIIERGKKVEERSKDIDRFWNENILDTESNVSFGEGGAGTFSDGKLNTQINDKSGRNDYVLKHFVECGAPVSILYDAKPHVGTDILKNVIINIRKKIEDNGGEFLFNSCVTDFVIEDNKLTSLIINGSRTIDCQDVILSIGHSARDTIHTLYKHSIPMTAKNFAVGFRVEHTRKFIDYSQYGVEKDFLPAASYKLTDNLSNNRGVYSFCMCPGGYVVNSSSENNAMVVNGMSYSGRNGDNSNSAIVVSVGEKEFNINDPMSALRYQLDIEKKTFEIGAGTIPQQLYSDFKNDTVSYSYGSYSSCTKGGTSFQNLRHIFSEEINNSFIEGMQSFDRKIPGFASGDTILSGIESRTSSPVRITRNENGTSSVSGLFPCGEGAGYAGGIMSAAMDGLKIAEKVINFTR